MKINIYQNYYLKEQEDRLDPSFIPYDNSRTTNPEYYEFGPILELYKTKKYLQSDYCGLFSYKFNTKTGISGEKFKKFIIENPGYDVYFINPHPYLTYCYYNIWEQGECWHEGLKEVAEIVLKEMGMINSINDISRHSLSMACYANFWVGNQMFWEKYGVIMEKLFHLIKSDVEIKEMFFSKTFHLNDKAVMFPFFFERLFTTVISLDKSISVCTFPYKKSEILNSCFYNYEKVQLENIIEWIDIEDKKNNYRVLKDFFARKSADFCLKTKILLKTNGSPESLN